MVNQTYGESLASIRMNGTVYAWSRQDNRMLWQKSVKQQNLVVDRFSAMPVLLFVSRSWKQRGRMNISTLSISAIHKQSGQMLIDSKIPSVYSGFHALTINADEPSIELRSYNVRMLLRPADEAASRERRSKGDRQRKHRDYFWRNSTNEVAIRRRWNGCTARSRCGS